MPQASVQRRLRLKEEAKRAATVPWQGQVPTKGSTPTERHRILTRMRHLQKRCTERQELLSETAVVVNSDAIFKSRDTTRHMEATTIKDHDHSVTN